MALLATEEATATNSYQQRLVVEEATRHGHTRGICGVKLKKDYKRSKQMENSPKALNPTAIHCRIHSANWLTQSVCVCVWCSTCLLNIT